MLKMRSAAHFEPWGSEVGSGLTMGITGDAGERERTMHRMGELWQPPRKETRDEGSVRVDAMVRPWIDCKKTLPPPTPKERLIFTTEPDIHIATMGVNVWWLRSGTALALEDVTHWMNLPEPPAA